MATLPDATSLGQRPVPRPSRAFASVSQTAASAVGAAVTNIGNQVSEVGLQIADRENTAMAKERDAWLSGQIRDLLYDPETGFANKSGGTAVGEYQSVSEKLDALKESAMKGLPKPAQKKLEDQLTRRLESARNTIDVHTSGERKAWINGASEARLEAARQDSLFDIGQTEHSIEIITSELRGQAVRDGWAPEKLSLEVEKQTSKVFSDQVLRAASSDPIAALEYLRANQDRMVPVDVANLEAKLQPVIKERAGVARGREAFFGGGDLSGAMSLAANNLGMNETDQREALQKYLKDGGVNLDPAKTAWCAALINSTLAQAGVAGTGSNLARSFLDWGNEATNPKKGDIVVLQRGARDGIYGHVGFFDGYNEDGSVRVLGGNQGKSGEVSVATFPASRVLGIRTSAISGDPQNPMAGLLEIEDPTERDAAIREYNLRVSVAKGERDARLATAQDAAFQMIESGGSVSELSLDVRQELGQTAMSSLREYQRKVVSNSPVETDPETYLNLRAMQEDDPAAFNGLNLMEYVGDLSQTDFRKFADAQKKPASDVGAIAASTLMTTAKNQMEAAGFDTTPKPGTNDARRMAAVQTRLIRWQDDYIKENGRQPGILELDQEVARLLIPIVINPRGIGNQVSERALDLGSANISESKLLESDVTLTLSSGEMNIPKEVIKEQIAEMKAEGVLVTAESLMERVIDLLGSAGIQ